MLLKDELFCNVLLVDLNYWKMNWFMGRGFSIYCKVLRICLECDKGGSSLRNVGWIRVFERCPKLHQQECSLTVFRGHYPIVPASSVNFPRNRSNWGVGFSPWEVNSNVRLIKLVTHSNWYLQSTEESNDLKP